MSVDGAIERVAAAGHPAQTEWLWTELTLLEERWDAARHPFYERWCSGALTPDALALYASEYDHLVVAVATLSKRASAKADGLLSIDLARRADDDDVRVGAFRRFAKAAGWGGGATWHYGEDPLPSTVGCACALVGVAERSLAQDLVVLSAIEAAQRRVAAVARGALRDRYGFDARATAYLEDDRDDLCPGPAWAACEELFEPEDPFALLGLADGVHRAHWALLDGVAEAARL